MFFKWCPHCGISVRAGGFCHDCRIHLKPCSRSADQNLQALYRYQGILRSVILRGKVNNENTAYKALCDLFTSHPMAIAAGLKADAVIPAPSSLWGRVRGRFDLAQGMALALGHALDQPVELLPRSFYFSYRKRAGKNLRDEKKREDGHSTQSLDLWQSKSVLLIDDIITTGFTLSHLATTLGEAGARVSCIALASAYQENQ